MNNRSWVCRLFLVSTLFITVFYSSAHADTPNNLEALKTSSEITIDGVLDEQAWADAAVGTDFIQREPDTGQPSSERTEVRVVYTPKILYVGVYCFDSEPSLVINKEMQRDQPLWRDDSLDILFDTFDDNRNAYVFETNPNGAQTDALITDEGRSFNLQWDGVWNVKAQVTADGWVAEIAIPFSTLRFDPAAEQWGFQVRRIIRRRAEEAYLTPILLDAVFQRVSAYGSLSGISDIEQGWNLNVKPFVVDSLETNSEVTNENDFDAGLDLKWGVTRGLSLDVTINTDFGETEVDALQVNLTRFSLFFEEKREFFLENAGIFDFGPGATGGGAPLLKVFHSRRIGIGPDGDEIPIDWGVRLSGRVGEWNLGVLDVKTDQTTLADGSVAIPTNNWGAFRATRNFGQRSSVGMIFTRRDEEVNTNQVYGLDLDYKPTRNLGFDAYFIESENSGSSETSDWSASAGSTWDGAEFDARIGWVRVGEDFDPRMGFLLRSNVYRYNTGFDWQPRPDSTRIMNYNFSLDAAVFTDLDGEIQSKLYSADLFGLRTAAADEVNIIANQTFEHLRYDFEISPGVIIPAGDYTFESAGVRYLTHSSRPVSVSGQATYGDFYDGTRLNNSVSLMLRPNRYIRSQTSWDYNDIELPGGDFTVNIIREQLAIALTPTILSSLFVQYNDLAELLSVNFRFNWIYKPGSDLFVVYNQTWNAASFSNLATLDRKFIVKFTYLFQR